MNSSAVGGFGFSPLRSRICFMTSNCMLSGTGAQRLNWVAQKALPCVDERSSSAMPKDSATGISALTIIMSSSVVMSSTRARITHSTREEKLDYYQENYRLQNNRR